MCQKGNNLFDKIRAQMQKNTRNVTCKKNGMVLSEVNKMEINENF